MCSIARAELKARGSLGADSVVVVVEAVVEVVGVAEVVLDGMEDVLAVAELVLGPIPPEVVVATPEARVAVVTCETATGETPVQATPEIPVSIRVTTSSAAATKVVILRVSSLSMRTSA
jgi:hypothetical protein